MTLKIIALFAVTLLTGMVVGQTANPKYNEEKAKLYEADAYGMKSYYFIVLKSGETISTDKAYIDSCFRGHMANIGRLVKEGKIIVAGPFGKNDDDFRGLFILNVSTLEEAESLMKTDPAIAEGLLKPLYYPWYGSAALPAYLETADELWQVKP